MAKRWSKLQRELYNLLDEDLKIQIHCNAYRMNSQFGSTDLPRYWITLEKEIILDYPKQFLDMKLSDYNRKTPRPDDYTVKSCYPYMTDIGVISDIIRDYIDTPLSSLLEHDFEFDTWGITDIFKAADRRIGKNRLAEHFRDSENEAVIKILNARNILKTEQPEES